MFLTRVSVHHRRTIIVAFSFRAQTAVLSPCHRFSAAEKGRPLGCLEVQVREYRSIEFTIGSPLDVYVEDRPGASAAHDRQARPDYCQPRRSYRSAQGKRFFFDSCVSPATSEPVGVDNLLAEKTICAACSRWGKKKRNQTFFSFFPTAAVREKFRLFF